MSGCFFFIFTKNKKGDDLVKSLLFGVDGSPEHDDSVFFWFSTLIRQAVIAVNRDISFAQWHKKKTTMEPNIPMTEAQILACEEANHFSDTHPKVAEIVDNVEELYILLLHGCQLDDEDLWKKICLMKSLEAIFVVVYERCWKHSQCGINTYDNFRIENPLPDVGYPDQDPIVQRLRTVSIFLEFQEYDGLFPMSQLTDIYPVSNLRSQEDLMNEIESKFTPNKNDSKIINWI